MYGMKISKYISEAGNLIFVCGFAFLVLLLFFLNFFYIVSRELHSVLSSEIKKLYYFMYKIILL